MEKLVVAYLPLGSGIIQYKTCYSFVHFINGQWKVTRAVYRNTVAIVKRKNWDNESKARFNYLSKRPNLHFA